MELLEKSEKINGLPRIEDARNDKIKKADFVLWNLPFIFVKKYGYC